MRIFSVKSASFKTKLLFLIAFMAAISVTICIGSARGLQSVEESYEEVTSSAMPKLETLNNMFLAYRSVRINLRSLGLSGLTHEQAEAYVQNTKEQIDAYETLRQSFQKMSMTPQEKILVQDLDSAWEHFKAIGKKALQLHSEGSPEAKAELNKIFLVDCPAAAKDYTVTINKLKEFQKKIAEESEHAALSLSQTTIRFVVMISFLGILTGLVVGFFFASAISKAISQIANNLTVNASELSSASQEIAHSSEMLSSAATEQAASLQETATSLEEISTMVQKAAESAEATAENSLTSQQKAEQGQKAMTQMLGSMDIILNSNESILAQINDNDIKMQEIVKVIHEIGAKTKVINEIVFQTKLLSFNASVEAARAGEHGKGFAVVAEEIGSLAKMSGNAAQEITVLLNESIAKVEEIAVDTKSKVEKLLIGGKESVDNGIAIARQCATALDDIVLNVTKVAGLSRDIAQASNEQANGVTEINRAVSQLDAVTQQHSSSSTDAANAAKNLFVQSESLKSSVSQLITMIHG